MSSRTLQLVLVVAALAVAASTTLVTDALLLGLFAASLFYLAVWLAVRVADVDTLGSVGRARAAVSSFLALLALAYALLVAQQVLLGVVVALTVLLVAWATAPGGPVARFLR